MPDPVTRLNAALAGRYAIGRGLGEGGMATVYLADDLKHNRKVALKVLKPELAAVVGAERFLAEIQVTANLQHPNILPLFDSGEAGTFLFYVMPYVEGDTLKDRLAREGQLPVNDAVAIARDIADALQAAHEQGVIHRDIKPGNVLISRGKPLISDFGIALALSASGAGERLTETGLSLGTPYYMSPEQATGDQAVGASTDTYALGCVLYEMLVGDPPYAGSTAQAVLGKIIAGKRVSATEERPSVPANVDAAIRKALEKLPADRFTSAQDFARALADEPFRYGELVTEGASAAAGPWNWLTVAFATTTILLAGLAAWDWLRPSPQAPAVYATRLPIDLDGIALGAFDDIVVSPDGSRFAVTGTAQGERALYWRIADEESFRLVPGTEGARGATFSPDGDWIAYSTTDFALFKVSLSGGAPNLLVRAGTLSGGLYAPHWGDDETIVFADLRGSFRVPDTGGESVTLSSEFGTPHLLPGGWAVLGSRIGGGVILMDLVTDTIRELAAIGFDPEYVETGHILFVDDSGGLWALPFDAANGNVLGDAVPILDGVRVPSVAQYRFPRYSVSRNGTLVYGAGGGGAGAQRRLLVVDLEGNEEAVPLDPRPFYATQWSPDAESVAYDGTEPGGGQRDIYTYNVALRTVPRRLTFDGDSRWPVWSPDGTRIAFASRDTATFDLYVKRVNDESSPQMIVTLPGSQWPTHWPSDDLLLFETGDDYTPTDLWMVDLSADSAVASPYLESEADLLNPMISPDGDLVAYTSDESGTVDVYVRSFPEARQPEIVSRGGGQFPSWSPDGNTIYYWTPGPNTSPRSLIAARIERGPPFAVISRDTTAITGIYPTRYWDLHPDGDRLVIPQDVNAPGGDTAADDAPEPERFIVVTNWFEELRQRMGN